MGIGITSHKSLQYEYSTISYNEARFGMERVYVPEADARG